MINVNVPNRSIKAHVNNNSTKVDNSNIKVVKGDKGAVFTPHVDELSNLSWTNNGGLENPPTQNIRGRDGSAVVDRMTNKDIERIMEG